MSVSSYKGDGLHGHLGIIMTEDEYFAVATDAFPAPKILGAMATIMAGRMAAQITETNWAHTEATHLYHRLPLYECKGA
jgi:hypothetical protein